MRVSHPRERVLGSLWAHGAAAAPPPSGCQAQQPLTAGSRRGLLNCEKIGDCSISQLPDRFSH